MGKTVRQAAAPVPKGRSLPPSASEMEEIRQEALQFAGIGLMRYGFDGTVLYIDRGALRIFDLEKKFRDPSKAIGRNVAELIVYTSPKGLLRAETRKHKHLRGFEYSFRTLTGIDKWVSYDAYLVRDGRGGRNSVQLIISDITERKRAEQQLQHVLAGARCILWSAVVTPRRDGEFIWELQVYNERAAEQLLPLDRGARQTYSDAWHDNVPKEDLARMDRTSGHALRTGLPGYAQEYRCRRKDGAVRWLSEDARIRKLGPGRWLVVGVCTDVTERKLADERERATADGLRAVVSMADELMSCPDIDALCRRAVELSREKLGLERAGVFLRDGPVLRGTFGTDFKGRTTDERGHQFPTRQDWLDGFQKLKPRDRRMLVTQHPLTEVRGGKVTEREPGWVAITPIQAGGELIGVLSNDTALTRAPMNETQQDIVSVFCSLLGAVIQRKRAERHQKEVSDGLRAVVAAADELLSCADNEALYRRAVELARERLGLERCALFLRQGAQLRCTYGTDRQGRTTDEHGHVFATTEEWVARLKDLRGGERRTLLLDQAYHEWKNGKSVPFGHGWVAVTPIQSTTEFMGVFCHDAAVTGAPADPARLEIVSVYCSLLGPIIERKTAHSQQEAISAGLRSVLAIADELIACAGPDDICRRTVELARERLGVERCAIYLKQDDALRGTYGTNCRGETTVEHGHTFEPYPDRLHQLQARRPEDRQVVIQEEPYTEWENGRAVRFGKGWVAITPIQTPAELIGVFSNDTAITQAPPDPARQEIITVLCSILGAVLSRKRVEAKIRGLTLAVVSAADELIRCPDLDTLNCRAVELAREKFGVERCSIFLRDGEVLRGTYGTDRRGGTTDERAYTLDLKEDWVRHMLYLEPHETRRIFRDVEYTEWRGGEPALFGRGWIVTTPIKSANEVLGVFCNDGAITGAPMDETRQEIVTIYCSLLGAIVLRKRAEEDLRRAHGDLERRVQERTAELVATNRALAEKERIQKAILDNIPDIAWLKDRESRFIAVNEPFAAAAGFKVADLGGKNDFDAWPKDLAERYRADDKDVMQSRRRKVVEEPLVDKSGAMSWIETIKTPILDDRGEVIGTTGIARDISERKRAEEILRRSHEELEQLVRERTADLEAANAILQGEIAERRRVAEELRESRERYRVLVESSPDFIYLLDREERCLYVNPSGARWIGRAVDDIVGRKQSEFFPSPLGEAHSRRVQEVFATGKPFASERAHSLGDRETWLEAHLLPIANAAGEVVSVLGISRDITERKRVEIEIRRLAMVVQQAAEAVVVCDTRGDIQYVNPAFERITGYTAAEALGKNPRILKSGRQDQDFYRRMWETLAGGGVWSGHFTNRRKDGSPYEAEATISSIRDSTGVIVSYVAASRDVTREMQLEQQFRQAQKMEAVGRLAGGIAHDFNNLLTSILGYGRLIHEELAEGHPMRADVEEILHSGERAAALTKQLLAFSRKQMVQAQPVSLNAVVVEMDKLLRRTLGEDIELVTLLDSEMGCARADQGLLEQVIMNLAINGRDAMPGGGTLTIQTSSVRVDEAKARRNRDLVPGEYVQISVADTGTGMPPDVQEHCFEPFYTTKEKGKGTGLGLSIVYSIVRQFDGVIELESAAGRGTTVRIYFPTLQGARPAGPARSEVDLPHGTETILVVEDEETVRRLAVRILESLGYRVLQARHGGEALLICERHKEPIHLVLTDVVMPQMGGQELVDRLRQIRRDFRVLYMSGFVDKPFATQPGGEPVPLLLKPFNNETLAGRIRQVLDRR